MPQYNFLPIPEANRPQNDANQQIADSLFQLETENNLQSGSGWDGMGMTTDQNLTLTQIEQQVEWDESMSNRFGSVLASSVNDAMVFGPGVFAQSLGGTIHITAPSGQVRSIVIELIDLLSLNVRGKQIIIVEKQVEEVFFSGAFLSQIDSPDAWAIFIKADVGDADFAVRLEAWTWYAWHISPLGYVPPVAVVGVTGEAVVATQSHTVRGFFGGMARDVASGIGPLQSVTAPEPIEGFDILKEKRSSDSTLATALIVIDSDGIWEVRFSLAGMVQINRRYLFSVFLNGVQTECAAVADTSNQTAEISITGHSLFSLVTGDELQLQIESPNGPANWETEFGSFTVYKAGEAP